MDWTLDFLLPRRAHREVLTLDAGIPLRLIRARGREIACEHGCVWITAPGIGDDIYLHAGQHWTVPVSGLVLVETEGSARVSLRC